MESSKIILLSGSSRRDNNTLKVAKALDLHFQKLNADSSLIDFQEYDFGFFNQGYLKEESLTPFQKTLINSWRNAKHIVLLSPEYNWFPSAEMINLLHHVGSQGFKDLFEDRTFSFVGVSSGSGGRLPAVQLSMVVGKIIGFLSTQSVVNSKIFEARFVPTCLDADGRSLGNDLFDDGLAEFADYMLNLAKRWD